MRKVFMALCFVLLIAACVETKTAVIQDAMPTMAPVAVEDAAALSVLDNITGVAPNSVIVIPRRVNKHRVIVDFWAYKITRGAVFGMAINLSYDANILDYKTYKRGGFLERGGKSVGAMKPIYMVSSSDLEPGLKKLVVGGTLFRGTPGVVGTGKLISLLFDLKQDTPTDILFLKNKLKNPRAEDITEIN